MDNEKVHRLNAAERVVDFGGKHPLNPPISRAGVLFGRIDTGAKHLRLLQGTQDEGSSLFFAGLAQRNTLQAEVKDLMRPIAEIAAGLKAKEHPGIRQKFIMPRGGGVTAVVGRGRAFLKSLEPVEVKALFTERGLEATFDADLKTKVDALEAAASLKYEGLVKQVGGTAGLAAASYDVLQDIRELNGILRQRYKGDPEMLAAWDAARRVQRPPKRKKAQGPTGEGGKLEQETVTAPTADPVPAVPPVTGAGGTAGPANG